jgi:hypothetical protein
MLVSWLACPQDNVILHPEVGAAPPAEARFFRQPPVLQLVRFEFRVGLLVCQAVRVYD